MSTIMYDMNGLASKHVLLFAKKNSPISFIIDVD
jgi:hypothetical protein